MWPATPVKRELGGMLIFNREQILSHSTLTTGYVIFFKSTSADSFFTFVEEWADAAALNAHLATPHPQAVLAQAPALLAMAPDTRRYAEFS